LQLYIAGLKVKIDGGEILAERSKKYKIEFDDNASVIVIKSEWETLKKKHPNMSDQIGEYIASGDSFYRDLVNYNGIMLHSSCVVVDDKAYLFSADPGTGKSTHTQLWLQKFGDRAFILNDDKPALRWENGEWFAYGTPWSGKHDISVNARVKVAGIAMLERGEQNSIVPFSGKDAIFAVYKQVNRPKGAEYRMKILKLLDQLLKDIPLWKLTCNMDVSAVDVSYGAMSKAAEEKK